MRPVAGLDHDVDVDALDRDLEDQPLVIDLDDVAAGPADDGGERAERSRRVLDADAQAPQLSVAHPSAPPARRPDAGVGFAAPSSSDWRRVGNTCVSPFRS